MVRRFTQHIIPALLALIALMAGLPFVESILRIKAQATPAIEWHGVRVITPTVKAGGVLEIVYLATVNKQCPSDLRGFLVASDQTVPVRFAVISGGYRKPSGGPIEIPVKIVLPSQSDAHLASLTSGRYVYRTLVTRFCADGVEDDDSVPDVEFYLEVPQKP